MTTEAMLNIETQDGSVVPMCECQLTVLSFFLSRTDILLSLCWCVTFENVINED